MRSRAIVSCSRVLQRGCTVHVAESDFMDPTPKSIPRLMVSSSKDPVARVESGCAKMLQAFHERQYQHGLPGFMYQDPDVFAAELQLIHYQEWLFACHDAELKGPGAYITLQIGAHPIMIVRGTDGKLRAFHNICRHRGHKLCLKSQGKAQAGGKRFVCPYHQWSYSVDDGALLTARELTKTINRDALALKPIHLEMVKGYVFICLAAVPPSFAPVRAMKELYAEPFGLEDTKIAHQQTVIENGNWKIVWENNRECYHCAGAHPQLRRTFPSNTSGSLPTAEELAFSKRAESLGLPSAFVRADDYQYRATRLPFVNGAQSMTMDGQPAVKGVRLGRMPDENVGDVLFYHYPTTWNHWQADHVVSFRVLPISPTETEVVTTWLVPAAAEEGVHYDLRTLTEVWEVTNMQDKELVENCQIGVTSPAFTPGPYSPVNEAGVIDFIEWHEKVIRRRTSTGELGG